MTIEVEADHRLTSSAITLVIESICGGETMPLRWSGREARAAELKREREERRGFFLALPSFAYMLLFRTATRHRFDLQLYHSHQHRVDRTVRLESRRISQAR